MSRYDVCISGGGPAGMMTGLLLASLGNKVLVLESQKNFDREFRGEVLMPLLSQMMHQIGFFEEFTKAEHLKLEDVKVFDDKKELINVPFKEICKDFPFAIWMPQPVFLNHLYEKAKKFPNFEMWFSSSVSKIDQKNDGVSLQVKKMDQEQAISASLLVDAEGRWSAHRKSAGFEMEFESHGFDIIWFEVQRPQNHPRTVQGFFSPKGNFLIAPKYPDLLQCGLFVLNGGFDKIKRDGLESFRTRLKNTHPAFVPFANGLKDFGAFHVLQAKLALAKQWAKNRIVLVGDAAHTMSPVGAIGVSVAIGTAIVAADVIHSAIRENNFSDEFLGQIQARRIDEVIKIQKFQLRAENAIQTGSSWLRKLTPILLPIALRLGLLQRVMRSIVTLTKPLPLKNDITL